MSMQTSSRLYHCCRCHAQVIICRRCDRGQRYCAGGCSQDARAASLKRASEKYQASRSGRANNAARQQRFRQRQQQKVTHHRSPRITFRDLLRIKLDELKEISTPVQPGTTLHCHHCGAVCEPFLRNDFLHSSRFKQTLRRY